MDIKLEPRQSLACASAATEILYGGAAGGGKSFLLRVSAIRWCLEVAGIQVYLFRRTLKDLRDNHLRGPTSFFALLAGHLKSGHIKFRHDEKEFVFWNDSNLHLCYCDSENDVENYRGAEMHVFLPDELTHFSDYQYRFLRSRVRLAGLQVPDQYAGDREYVKKKALAKGDKSKGIPVNQRLMAEVISFEKAAIERLNKDPFGPSPFPRLPRIESASNPGSIGHAWVKRTFVSPKPQEQIWQAPPDEGGMLRQYIPAKLSDNPHLMREDPEYENRLRGLGHQDLVRAIMDGDWDIIAGQAFEKLNREKHCIDPLVPPKDWICFGSFDWGSTKPFSFGMWCVSDGTALPDGRTYPRGALIRYAEWYGWNSKPDEGLRMEVGEVAEGILKKLGARKMAYIVADPSCWKVDGGPSHAETMMRHGVVMRKADNSRHAGYLEVRERIAGTEEGPMLYVTRNCHDGFWRTIPEIVMDKAKYGLDAEDIDTDQEDHCADEVKYACMSRPWANVEKKKEKQLDRWFLEDEDDEAENWKTA